jgi:hypothetical protein
VRDAATGIVIHEEWYMADKLIAPPVQAASPASRALETPGANRTPRGPGG